MNDSLSNNSMDAHSWLQSLAPCLAVVELRWTDETQMTTFAQDLANRNGIGMAFVALDGNLGAGKTTLVRNLLQSLGVKGRIKSPTYTIMESYILTENPPLTASHFDFYRFNDPQEWEDAGFRDVFAAPGLKLVEWPEKAGQLLPSPDLVVSITSQEDDSRDVTLKAYSPLGQSLILPVGPLALASHATIASNLTSISPRID